MPDDLDDRVVDLACDVQLRYSGPQTERRIYFGTLGLDPAFNNKVVRLLEPDFIATDPGEEFSNFTSLACSSSPWTLIVFSEDRLDWLIERLNEIVSELQTGMSEREGS